jgi:hypothetical protein
MKKELSGLGFGVSLGRLCISSQSNSEKCVTIKVSDLIGIINE